MTRIIIYLAAIFKLLVSFVSFDDLSCFCVVLLSSNDTNDTNYCLFAAIFKLLVSFVSFDDLDILFVVPMPHMPFVASLAPIHRHALCLELRVLIEIFPRIILRLVSLLSLPGMLLACIVLRVWLERRHLVEVFMSFVTHVLYLCCVVVVISLIGLKAIYLFLSIERALCALYG